MIDPMTGEIILTDDIDLMLGYIMQAEKTIRMLKVSIDSIKQEICKKVQGKFFNSNTARIEGEKYKCKIEFPTKILWDQKKLHSLYLDMHTLWWKEPANISGALPIISIASYKVNTREYKKLINTVGSEDFNKFKEELISANLGISGSPKITIET